MAAAYREEIDWASLMPDVAERLLGPQNPRHSTRTNPRWGNNGSMSVDFEKGVFRDHEADVGGGVLNLIKHKLGCNDAGAMRWLESEQLLEPPPPAPVWQLGGRTCMSIFYDYRDEAGNVLYRVERRPNHKFIHLGPDGRGGFACFEKCMDGVRRVPYRLPELLDADPTLPIYICEGEKDVDRLLDEGLIATTNSGGGGNWKPELNEHLRGRQCILLEDNDEKGAKHVAQVKRQLRGVAAEIAVLKLPDLPKKGDVSDWLDAGGTKDQLQHLARDALANASREPPATSATAPAALDADKHGFLASISNLEHALRDGRFCGIDIARDDFTGQTMFARHGTENWQQLTDEDQVNLRLSLERNGFKRIGKEDFRDILRLVARDHRFDSAQRWLAGLEWDGVERVEGFLTNYFGVESSPYSTAVSRYWLTAHAARVMEPGCQCDMVPILVSPEGRHKSTSLTAMVPSLEHFVEIDLEHKDADLSRKMQGALIGELAELKGLSGRSAEANKAWVTRRFEEWRPVYYEGMQRAMRRLVIVGTTNETRFLSERTGDRRWLPIKIGNADRNRIAADRDLLWAEARDIVKRRVAAGLDSVAWEEASELAGQEREQFTEEDSWLDAVQRWQGFANVHENFTTQDALRGIEVPPTHMTPANQQRIAKVLRKLGYVDRKRKLIAGKKSRVWTRKGPEEDH